MYDATAARLSQNVISNSEFSGVRRAGVRIRGPLCDGWEVRHRGPTASSKFLINSWKTETGGLLRIELEELDNWFRIVHPIPHSAFSSNRYHFETTFSTDEDVTQNAYVAISILETEPSGFAKNIFVISEKLKISATQKTFHTTFEFDMQLNPEFEYSICYMLSEPTTIEISAPQLVPTQRFHLPPNFYADIDKRCRLASDMMADIAPYRSASTPGCHDLTELTTGMSQQCKKDRTGWIMKMISVALRTEAFATALTLVTYLLNRPYDLTDKELGDLSKAIVDTYIAFGRMDELYQFLLQKPQLVSSNDQFYTALCCVLLDRDMNVAGGAKLPSGAQNTFLLNKLGTRTRGLGVLELMPNITAQPEQGLVLANCHAGVDPTTHLSLFNRYLAHFGLPAANLAGDAANILENLRFAQLPSVEADLKVSVIVAGYNCERTIGYALASVLNQSYRNIEVLFCDDASTDGTLAATRAFANDPRLTILSSETNQGPYNIRNALIERATGDFITFHDADDLALPGRIEKQLEAIINRRAVLSLGKWLRISAGGQFSVFRDHKILRMCVNSIMFHRRVYDALGPYRSVACAADTEFYETARIAFGDDAIAHVNMPLVLGLASEGSLTNTAGMETLDNGYRAPARRKYAEIAGRQRMLGKAIVTDEDVVEVLKSEGIYRAPSNVVTHNFEPAVQEDVDVAVPEAGSTPGWPDAVATKKTRPVTTTEVVKATPEGQLAQIDAGTVVIKRSKPRPEGEAVNAASVPPAGATGTVIVATKKMKSALKTN